jgi:type IV pilus assembly protein PilO
MDLKIDQIKEKVKEKVEDFFKDEEMRLYAVIGATAVFALLFIVFLMMPGFTELSNNAREVGTLNRKINIVNKKINNLDEMKGRLSSLRQEEIIVSSQLPAEKEVPTLLREFANIAKTSGVQILSITPYAFTNVAASGKVKQYYRAMPILITAKCGYHELGEFVSDIEEMERLVTIEDIEINNDSSDPRRHKVKIISKTYVSSDDEKK